jgi:hypothetical protein
MEEKTEKGLVGTNALEGCTSSASVPWKRGLRWEAGASQPLF